MNLTGEANEGCGGMGEERCGRPAKAKAQGVAVGVDGSEGHS